MCRGVCFGWNRKDTIIVWGVVLRFWALVGYMALRSSLMALWASMGAVVRGRS